MPYHVEYYLKKEIYTHHNRSVNEDVYMEMIHKLPLFPEKPRLVFLHLWALGLRCNEVCTLKGNAYYMQGRDAWIQVYQYKMKNYKKVPIPLALYKLMKVYIRKKWDFTGRICISEQHRWCVFIWNFPKTDDEIL